MIEPSNAELSELPETSRQYIQDLLAHLEALEQATKDARDVLQAKLPPFDLQLTPDEWAHYKNSKAEKILTAALAAVRGGGGGLHKSPRFAA